MSKVLPILYSAHHASASFDFGNFNKRCGLTEEQRLQFSDLGTDLTVPTHGLPPFKSEYSRGIVDLNRALDNPTLFPEFDFGNPEKHRVWNLTQEPTDNEKALILKNIYWTYHNAMLAQIQSFTRPGVVVAWDNTAPYENSYEINIDGNLRKIKPFNLINGGDYGVADTSKSDVVLTCDPQFLKELSYQFHLALKKRGLVDEVGINTYFETPNKCGYIARRYNTNNSASLLNTDKPIVSCQLEYDTSVTHDPTTLTPDYNAIEKLRTAFEEAIEETYQNLLTWNV